MATVIDISYFYGDHSVPQLSQTAVAAAVQMFIDKHEPALLRQLFGYKLYKEYAAWNGTDAGRFKDLRDGKEYTDRYGRLNKWQGLRFTEGTAKKSLIANYVYYWWIRSETTATAGAGEVSPELQNAKTASSAHKQCRAWNEMAQWNRELLEFLLSNESTYPEFTDDHYPVFFPQGLIQPINDMNI